MKNIKQDNREIKEKQCIDLQDVASVMGKTISKFYDEMLMQQLSSTTLLHEHLFGKIIGYKKVKEPVYLTIKIPKIEKDYDNDYEYGTGEFRGLLISFREVKLFRIGTKIIEEPIYKKVKTGQTIKFARYSDLKNDREKIRKSVKKLSKSL